MFGIFKKKDVPREPSAQEVQIQEFARRFEPEEFTILAVTGANGFDGERAGEDKLWTAGIALTAWMEEDFGAIHRRPARLVTLADEKLLEYLRRRVPPDFVLKVKVRRSLEGDEFQLIGMPETGFDPDLKTILEEQKRPVSHFIEGVGTFVLNRSNGWFQAEADWLGASIQITADKEEALSACAGTAKALLKDQALWDRKVRTLAAENLLGEVRRRAAGSAEDEQSDMTQAFFLERMELESVQAGDDGSFEFWFNDGELYLGQAIRVSGNLTDGPTEANMEG